MVDVGDLQSVGKRTHVRSCTDESTVAKRSTLLAYRVTGFTLPEPIEERISLSSQLFANVVNFSDVSVKCFFAF